MSTAEPAAGSQNRRRGRGLSPRSGSYLGLVLGGGLAIVAAAQPWFRAVGQDLSVAITGIESTAGLSQALAVVTLAGTLLMLVLRVRGRRVVAVLLALTGLAIALIGVLRIRPSSEAVLTQVREVSLADQFALDATAWPWIFAAAGVLVLGGALLTLVTAGRWPTRADRFEREGPARPVAPTDEPADVWKAMDAGMDPTVDATPSDLQPPPPDPDVRNVRSRATMEGDSQSPHSSRSAE